MMTRSAFPLLPLLILAACLAAGAALAQDPLDRARAEYRQLSGEWAEAGRGCADSDALWSFGMETVRAGDDLFGLMGIGAGPETIRLDLISRRTGRRLPLALGRSGERLEVRGRGVAVTLLPCDGFAPVPIRPRETITTRPLDTLPGEEDLPARPGGTEEPGRPESPEAETGISPEAAYEARLTGAWRGADGTCGWRLGPSRIFVEGAAFDVVNFSGSAERIGIQALRADGTPATFTLTPEGTGALGVTKSVVGESASGATLTRC